MGIRNRVSLEGCVAIALGVTVFTFALGSSSVRSLHQFGGHAKWLCLAAMVPISGTLALAKRSDRRPAPSLYVLAGLLVLLAYDSAFWSVAPVRTLKLATSWGLLVAVVTALGIAATRPEVARALVTGVLGGAVALAVGGVVLFFVHHSLAVSPYAPLNPERFQGLTENPNTASLVCALVLPIALWRTVSAPTVSQRVVAGAGLLLLFGTIVASGSKGALGAGFVGAAVFAATFDRRFRPRLVLVAVVVISFLAGLGILDATLDGSVSVAAATAARAGSPGPSRAKSPTRAGGPAAKIAGRGLLSAAGGAPAAPAPAPTTTTTTTVPKTTTVRPIPAVPPIGSVAVVPRLSDELGAPSLSAPPQGRTLFGTSGRAQAWVGAIRIGFERPIAGYGFGTEAQVFVDRWYFFEGDRPENSFIGIFLQLGLVGLLLLVSIGIAIVLAARRALRPTGERAVGAACLGVVAAGTILAVVQSYIYAVGDIGTLPFWSAAFVLAGLAGPAARGRT